VGLISRITSSVLSADSAQSSRIQLNYYSVSYSSTNGSSVSLKRVVVFVWFGVFVPCSLKMCTSIWILMVMLYGVVAEWNTKDHMKREHSLTKPYIGKRSNCYWSMTMYYNAELCKASGIKYCSQNRHLLLFMVRLP